MQDGRLHLDGRLHSGLHMFKCSEVANHWMKMPPSPRIFWAVSCCVAMPAPWQGPLRQWQMVPDLKTSCFDFRIHAIHLQWDNFKTYQRGLCSKKDASLQVCALWSFNFQQTACSAFYGSNRVDLMLKHSTEAHHCLPGAKIDCTSFLEWTVESVLISWNLPVLRKGLLKKLGGGDDLIWILVLTQICKWLLK